MYSKILGLVIILCFVTGNVEAQNIFKFIDSTKNFEQLTARICRNTANEKEKAQAIYNWIARNIQYDYKAIEKNKTRTYTCNQVLKRRKGTAKEYSMLFVAMCREANMQAEAVNGYTKNWQFDNNDELFEPNHTWAVVRINNEWQLVDVAKGAGYLGGKFRFPKNILKKVFPKKSYYTKNKKFVFQYDPNYFMQDPEAFKLESLSADPIWQLTDTAMPIKVFANGTNAVLEFNKNVSKSIHKSKEIDNFLKENEYKQTVSCANRTINHNPNYKTKMIEKYFLDLDVYMDNKSNNPKAYIDSALQVLAKSEKILKDQKQDYTSIFTKLKQRNTEKKQITLAYKQSIELPSKQYFAKATRNIEACETAIEKEKKAKQNTAEIIFNKVIDRNSLSTENANSASVIAKKVDLKTAEEKTTSIESILNTDAEKLLQLKETNAALYDSIMDDFEYVRKAISKEIKGRNEMHDVFDDEVINNINEVKKHKLQGMDATQSVYNTNLDSIFAVTNRMHLNNILLLNNYKLKLKLMEQMGSNIENTSDAQSKTLTAFATQKENATSNSEANIKFFNASKVQNKNLQSLSKLISETFAYIKKTENFRAKLHKKNIKTAESFGKVVNKENMALLKKITKEVKAKK